MTGIKVLVVLLLFSTTTAMGQDFRATITGRVTDSTGSAIANAQVTVTNTETNAPTNVPTNESGDYIVTALQPGSYRLEVEQAGFKKFIQEGITLAIRDSPTVDVALEPGAVSETVTITADASALETNDASRGEVITGRRLVDLPLNGRNGYALAALVPGVNFTGRGQAATFLRTTSTASVSDVSISGGQPRFNEVFLDGVPNTGSDGAVQFVPSVEATQEFKVQTNSFDAEFGRFAGGVINASIKSGTNDFSGSLFLFHRNAAFNARDPFATDIPQFAYNQYGVSVGGPILLPRFGEGGRSILNGKNRSFFFFNYEGSREGVPRTFVSTVPTLAQRNGDFSALLGAPLRNANGTPVLNPNGTPALTGQIYDPATTRRLPNGTFVRDPFPGNIIPQNRFDPVARNLINLFPLPNASGLVNNFNISFRDPIGDDGYIVRLDHRFNDKHQIFGRYSQRRFFLVRQGAFQNNVTGDSENRFAPGTAIDYTFLPNSTTVLNFRYGFTRFATEARADSLGSDLTGFGFPASFVNALPVQAIPGINITGFRSLTSQGGRLTRNAEDGHTLRAGATKIVGNQTLRFGGEYRLFRSNRGARGAAAAGSFTFNNVLTRGPFPQTNLPTQGNPLASFLLGVGAGGEVGNVAATAEQAPYYGFYVQDDFRVTQKLTLNLGLRYEFEGANTERFNQFNRGFDLTASSPLEQQARINYAANPIPDVAPANFNVRGGLLFAGVNGQPRSISDIDQDNFSPRIGFAYSLTPKTVVRGGYGLFYGATTLLEEGRLGFTVSTPFVGSVDNANLIPLATLSNPFPNGFLTPSGSRQGLSTLVGQNISFVNPERKQPYTHQYQISIQRELPGNFLVDLAYAGSLGRDLPVDRQLNAIPDQFRAQALETFNATGANTLTTSVRNPFAGLITVGGLSGQTTTRGQLLRPFPQFTSLTMLNDSIGSSRYDSFQFKLTRRFSQGLNLLASYTFAKQFDRVRFLNENDTELLKELNPFDIPQRLVISGIYELPFGKGKRFLGETGGFFGKLIEGYQVNLIYQAQSGIPIFLSGAGTLVGDPVLPASERTVNRFFNTEAFRPRNSLELITTSIIPGLRSQGRNNFDISLFKTTSITEDVRLQFRAEAFNAFNRPEFTSPATTFGTTGFGRITTTNTFARQFQFGVRLEF